MNKRQAQILKTLYQSQDFLTLAELARLMDVSVKTIRNDITAVNQYLHSRQAGQLEAKPHLGIRCSISQTDWERLKSDSKEAGDEEEREILFYILWQLLKKGALTAQKLADRYYISRARLDKILTQAEEWFSRQNILLERRRGIGIQIHCDEYHYRLAVKNFYDEFGDDLYDPMRMISSRYALVDTREYTTLTILLNGFDIDGVIELISDLEAKFGIGFSYSATVSLVIYLSLCVTRSRAGAVVKAVPQPSCEIDAGWNETLSQTVAELLQERFGVTLGTEEHQFLLFCISVSEIQSFYDDRARREFESQNIPLCRLTVKFVRLVSEVNGLDLIQDQFYLHQMLLQLRTMIGRLNYQSNLKNPLLRQIKAKYPDMLAMIWSAAGIFEKELQVDLTEDEAGFLALLTGGAIERSRSHIKACIVCEYGVGIAQILKEKIERSVSSLTITAVFSKGDIKQASRHTCDFIISTVPLEGQKNKDVVLVDHLLDDADIRKIEQKMKQIRQSKRADDQKNRSRKNNLFTQELIYLDLDILQKDQLLHLLCVKMENLGYVSSLFEESVFSRERITSTEVGNRIAIPHGHCRYVNRSVVAFAKLSRPIRWYGEEEVDLIFLLAVDPDDKNGMKDEIMKFYQSLVYFMEDETQRRQLREAKDSGAVMKIFQNW